MNNIPVKNGKSCVFRVVRVSGTIKKAEEEAIRRAREMIVKARRELGEQSESTLDGLFGKGKSYKEQGSVEDVMMVDASGSEDNDDLSDG